MRKLSLLFITPLLLCQCSHKEKISNEIIIAENNYEGIYSQTLTLSRDSTFSFKLVDYVPTTEIKEDFKGKYHIKNDTVYFSQKVQFVEGDIAVLKNNFVEFINGRYPFKIQIVKSSILLKQSIFVDPYSDYSSFVFNPEFYNFFSASAKPYDLNKSELALLDTLLNNCIKKNPEIISRPIEKYYKICVAVINSNNEKEVRVYCVCKSGFNSVLYKNDSVCDGGDCYFRVIINLSKRSYYDLNVNGEA
jgi:hypothetical protein